MIRSTQLLRLAIPLCLLLTLSSPAMSAFAAEPRVEFVLIQEPGFPISGARRWIDMFKRIGVRSVQIRGAHATEELRVEKRGSETSPYYRVTAALTSKNTMQTPGAEFRLTDSTRLKNWIQRLKTDGLAGISGARNAFGLSAKQLLQVRTELSKTVEVSTAGLNRTDAIRSVASSFGVVIDPSLPLKRGGEAIGEELRGVSRGSAMAILLRPLGAALTIVRTSRGYEYAAVDSRKAKEAWPVGWPLERNLPRDAAPKLFQYTEDVDIRGVPLEKLITALKPRLGSPVFYDRNALAALQIDPAEVRVTLPAGRSYYKRILDRALTQAKLKMDIRLDDNDKAFLWITTLRDPFRNK